MSFGLGITRFRTPQHHAIAWCRTTGSDRSALANVCAATFLERFAVHVLRSNRVLDGLDSTLSERPSVGFRDSTAYRVKTTPNESPSDREKHFPSWSEEWPTDFSKLHKASYESETGRTVWIP